jgi:3-oxoacyl-[acyl-carrier protein] reductase
MASQGAIAQLRKGEIMATEKKVAIVTGASKGIGAGIAKALAAEGYVVVVNYASSKTGAEKVVGEIERAGRKALAIHADVSKQAEVKQLFSETLKAFGYLNVLINNAAVYGPSPLDAITEETGRKRRRC